MSQAQAHKACFLAKCFPILKIAPVFCSARVWTHLYCSTHRYLGTHICELQAKLASRGLQHKMCSCSVYLYSCWCCSSMCLVLSVTDSYPWVLMQRILAGWGLNVRSRKGRKLIFFFLCCWCRKDCKSPPCQLKSYIKVTAWNTNAFQMIFLSFTSHRYAG